MPYSANEKQRMDKLLNGFRTFIREQNYFDIVYSEKIGYLRIMIREHEDDGLMRLGSYDELLESLIDDMLMEEYERLSVRATDHACADMQGVRGKLLDIFRDLGEDARHCIQIMEKQLEAWCRESEQT